MIVYPNKYCPKQSCFRFFPKINQLKSSRHVSTVALTASDQLRCSPGLNAQRLTCFSSSLFSMYFLTAWLLLSACIWRAAEVRCSVASWLIRVTIRLTTLQNITCLLDRKALPHGSYCTFMFQVCRLVIGYNSLDMMCCSSRFKLSPEKLETRHRNTNYKA